MTLLQSPPDDPPRTDPRPEPAPVDDPVELEEPTARPPRLGSLIAIWAVVVVVALGLVLYMLEPLFQQRTQRALLDQYRAAIEQSTFQAEGLAGIEIPKKAPEPGSPVAILEIGRLSLQQVVVEGVSPSATADGPGHVPGTAGPGQPGNSAIVGRRAMYGGPFNTVGQLVDGDEILVSTTQGESVYKVTRVRELELTTDQRLDGASTGASIGSDPAPTDAGTPLDDAGEAANDLLAGEGPFTIDDLYAPSKDDRLTLVTSASPLPTNNQRVWVVTAKMAGKPFQPTPQNGRTDGQTGATGDPAAWAPALLALLALVATGAGAVVVYRRSSLRVAYLLTVPPLLVFVVLTAEQLSHLLPAWT